MITADRLPGPRIFTAGPHIDGEHPAYPADAVVARDAEEATRLAERNVQEGATALKIYFRLPFASAKAVIAVCDVHHIPCTAHLELNGEPNVRQLEPDRAVVAPAGSSAGARAASPNGCYSKPRT